MTIRSITKPELSVAIIGWRALLTGIALGLLFAVVLSYLFNHTRELLRALTITGDLLILPEREFRIYDLFFSALATTLGFGITMIFWMKGTGRGVRRYYRRHYALSVSLLLTIVVMLAVTRFGATVSRMPFGMKGFDYQPEMLRYLWPGMVLLPLWLFYAHWNGARLIYITGRWITASLICCTALFFLLFLLTTVDRERLNRLYYEMNRERYEFIDSMFTMAENRYGIEICDTKSEILQRRYAGRTTDLVLSIKEAFGTDDVVPKETLILQRIVIHNLNSHSPYLCKYDTTDDSNWPYATPESIYNQIVKHKPGSPETEILFAILGEQANLLYAPVIKVGRWHDYSHYERERASFRDMLLFCTEGIKERLSVVTERLRSDTLYKKHHHLLPETVQVN